ncbi:MAG: hypothetical protein L6Q98_04795 [Anaerolineae bacterium]|nr:hypothetical protein [Anaerolineae bacterium]NUQ03471.1 hypothetical protein [Anaerolineae bacterium]
MMRRSSFLFLATAILFAAACLRLIGLPTYPPGPHYDEAVNLLVVRSVVYGGARFFPMLEAYQGREALYFYLNAPMVAFVQDGMFALHLTNAFANLITIAAAIGLGRAMFPGRRGWLIGLVTGLLMAVSFHQVWLGRQAFRAVTLPLMQALALAFLFRGLRARRGAAWLIAAGIFAGGALYTYNSSRLFPMWLGVALLILVLASRFERRTLLRVLLFGVVMTLTAAPMIAYAFQRPDVFFGRLNEVTQVDHAISLLESVLLHAQMFFIQGDPYYRYNNPGQPYFTPPEGIALVVGLATACLTLLRRRIRRVDPIRAAGLTLLILSPLMVLPSVISVGGLPPSHMRSLGMVPLIFVTAAFGVECIVSRLDAGGQLRGALPAGLIAVLLVGSLLTGVAYFGWAARADVYYETDADLSAAARWAVDQLQPGERLYVAARDKGHPTVMIEPLPEIAWLGTDSFFLSPEGQSALYLFPRSAPPQPEWLSLLEPGRLDGLPLGPDGRTAFEAFRRVGVAQGLPEDTPANAVLRFVELDAPAIQAGAGGWITTAWQVAAPPEAGDFTPLIQIEDRHGSVYARGDAYMAGTDRWRQGETLYQQIYVELPALMAPDEYRVRAAWVARSADRYATYLNPDRSLGGIWADIGVVSVEKARSTASLDDLPMEHSTRFRVSPSLDLLGFDGSLGERRPGDWLDLTLYWRKHADGDEAEVIQADLLPAGDADTVSLWSGAPVDDRYTSDQWEIGEIVADRVRWRIPLDMLPGEAHLIVRALGESVTDEAVLGTLAIVDVPRLFEPPPFETPLNVIFDGQIALLGGTLSADADQFALNLVWRAERQIERDYKRFAHLLDANGTILAQVDQMPLANTYPTTLWMPGEVVVETLTLPAQDGAARIRLGWYLPETGARLHPAGEGAIIEPDSLLLDVPH